MKNQPEIQSHYAGRRLEGVIFLMVCAGSGLLSLRTLLCCIVLENL